MLARLVGLGVLPSGQSAGAAEAMGGAVCLGWEEVAAASHSNSVQ